MVSHCPLEARFLVRVQAGQYFDSLASLGRSVQAQTKRGRRSILSERSESNQWLHRIPFFSFEELAIFKFSF